MEDSNDDVGSSDDAEDDGDTDEYSSPNGQAARDRVRDYWDNKDLNELLLPVAECEHNLTMGATHGEGILPYFRVAGHKTFHSKQEKWDIATSIDLLVRELQSMEIAVLDLSLIHI